MSYDIGRYEGWIAIKRNRLALAYYPAMPSDLAEIAISEFVGLVRWGFAREAANIAAGPGRSHRSILFSRLKDLKVEQRRPFAQVMYGRYSTMCGAWDRPATPANSHACLPPGLR